MIIVPKKFGRQNSAYRHLNMKGAFGNEGALRFFLCSFHGDCSDGWSAVFLPSMPATLDRPKIAYRLQQARRLQSEIDKLQRKLGVLFNGVPKNLLIRNRYGFTAAEMTKIARNLHGTAKKRIAHGRTKEFRGSIEDLV
jgi:hypothetical protein